MDVTVHRGRPARRPEVWVHQAKGENVVYAPTTGAAYLMNETALAIWILCDGNTRPEEMVEAICEASQLHPDVVTEDVARILSEFDQAGLLDWEAEDAGRQAQDP